MCAPCRVVCWRPPMCVAGVFLCVCLTIMTFAYEKHLPCVCAFECACMRACALSLSSSLSSSQTRDQRRRCSSACCIYMHLGVRPER